MGPAPSLFARLAPAEPPAARGVYFGSTRPAGGASRDGSGLSARVEASRQAGVPLAPAVRSSLEPKLGHDLGHVRLQTGAPAARLAEELRTPAVTVGRDIFFGAQAFRPGTRQGMEVLAHELVHTVQQAGSPPVGAELAAGEAGDRFEDEAREVAEEVTGRPGGPIAPRFALPAGEPPSRTGVRLKAPRTLLQAYSPDAKNGVPVVNARVDNYNNNRPDSIKAPIERQKAGRDNRAQTRVSKPFNAFTGNDDFFGNTVEFAAGHLIADQFNVVGDEADLVPMERAFNGAGGTYGKFENQHVKKYLKNRQEFMADADVKTLLGAYWQVQFNAPLPLLAAPDRAYMEISANYGANRDQDLLSANALNILQNADANLPKTIEDMANQIPTQLTCTVFKDPFKDYFTYLQGLPGSRAAMAAAAGKLGIQVLSNQTQAIINALGNAAGTVHPGGGQIQQLAIHLANYVTPLFVAPTVGPFGAPNPAFPIALNQIKTVFGNRMLNMVPMAGPATPLTKLQAVGLLQQMAQNTGTLAADLKVPETTAPFDQLQQKAQGARVKAVDLLQRLGTVPTKLQNADALANQKASNFQLNPLKVDPLFRHYITAATGRAPAARYGI